MGKTPANQISLNFNSANLLFSLLEDIRGNLERLAAILRGVLALSSLKIRRLRSLRLKLEKKLNAKITSKVYIEKQSKYYYARIRLDNNKLLKRYLGKQPDQEISLIEDYNETLDTIKQIERYIDRIADALDEINMKLKLLIEEPDYFFPEYKEVKQHEQ